MNVSIIGTGKIVREALPVMKQVEGLRVTSIYARPQSEEKARLLAEEHGIPQVMTDFDEVLRSEADFLYIAVINTLHHDFARRALLAGKHVIIEKPIVMSPDEMNDLIELAVSRQCYVFEAMTVWHRPCYEAIVNDLLPRIGRVTLLQCNYSQRSSRYDRYLQGDVAPAFDPELCGGALMDLNVYNFAFVIGLFGAPQRAEYHANRGFNGIDTSGIALLHYPDKQAVLTAAKDSDSPSFAIIQGDEGWIRVDSATNEMRQVSYSICQQPVQTISPGGSDHRLLHEFLHFQQIFHRGDFQQMLQLLRRSQTVVRVMRQAIGN